jgi:hypothetical protein
VTSHRPSRVGTGCKIASTIGGCHRKCAAEGSSILALCAIAGSPKGVLGARRKRRPPGARSRTATRKCALGVAESPAAATRGGSSQLRRLLQPNAHQCLDFITMSHRKGTAVKYALESTRQPTTACPLPSNRWHGIPLFRCSTTMACKRSTPAHRGLLPEGRHS